jgi:hypothetical protein
MRRHVLAAGLIALTATAWAQEQPPPPPLSVYVPVEEDLWRNLQNALARLSMPLDSHQQIQELMRASEREAQMRATRKAALERNKPAAPPGGEK